MPVAVAGPLQAGITFSLPDSRLPPGTDVEVFEVTHTVQRPKETVVVPIIDLAPELKRLLGEQPSPLEQLETRGFSLLKHETSFDADDLNSQEGTDAYMAEQCELVKKLTGATEVIAWNSVVRRADINDLKMIPRQTSPERGQPPTTKIQPTASLAHIDQNAFYGGKICQMATKDPDVMQHYSRCQIINIWRPLRHAVTNSPLAVMDYRSLSEDGESDLSTHASIFGFGHDVHHNPKQRWNYIQHQKPDEIILIKCFDSYQGRDGIAKYCAHVATDIINEPPYDGEIKPRESVEVRLVVLHK